MVNKEKIKKALDAFENDEFSSSSDTLRSEIKNSVNTFLKDKLKLKNDPLEVSKDEEEE